MFKPRYKYRTASAIDHARTSAPYADEEDVFEGNVCQISQTWMVRVATWMKVVLMGDLIRPENILMRNY
jgi:hypothetical protein